MNKRRQLKSRIFQARVRALLNDGYSVSKIAKELDVSYEHTKRIAAWVQKEENEMADGLASGEARNQVGIENEAVDVI